MWRFPYFCYKHGGVTFLIPYGLCSLLMGFPVFFVDISLGQYLSLGPTNAYASMAPICLGLGWTMVTMALVVSIYYNMILAWTVYYIRASFMSPLPWTKCVNETTAEHWCKGSNISYLASKEFFKNDVLGMSSSSEPFKLQVHLVVCLGIAWIVVFLCVARGLKRATTVVYVTVFLPYIIVILLMAWSYDKMRFEDWLESATYYFSPSRIRLGKIMDLEIWVDAISQVCFSLGFAQGGHITLASYNPFKENTLRNAVIIVLCNAASSLLYGFLVFSSLTQLANDSLETIEDVFSGEHKLGSLGVEVAFVAYPVLLGRMNITPWSMLFFVMVLALGIDTMIVLLETTLTAIFDNFTNLKRMYVPVVTLVCVIIFLLSLPMCTASGIFIVELFHVYSSRLSTALVVLAKVLVVQYLFGFKEFIRLLQEEMLVWVPMPIYYYLAFSLSVMTPAFMVCLLAWVIRGEETLIWKDQVMPDIYRNLGWVFSAASYFFVPTLAVYAAYRYRGKGWRALFTKTEKFRPKHILESQNARESYVLQDLEVDRRRF